MSIKDITTHNPLRSFLQRFQSSYASADDTVILETALLETAELPVVELEPEDFEALLPLALEWQPEVGEFVLTSGYGWRDSLFSGVVEKLGEYPMCGEYEGCPAAYIVAPDGSAAAWFLLDELTEMPAWTLENFEAGEVA